MRYLLAIVLSLGVFTAFAQKNKFKGAGFDYTKTAPNYIPVRGTESEIAIDSLTGKWMQYSYQSAAWWHLGYFVTETDTTGAPSYTPNKVKSVMAINAGDSLYHYRGGSWHLIAGGGGGGGITDGDKGDIDVTGGGSVWTIDTGAITMIKINQSGAAIGQVIKWNGTAWAPADDETSATGAGGIYGPSDLVTYNHVSTLDSGLTFSSAEDTAYFNIVMAPGAFGSAAYFNSDSIRMRRYDVAGSNEVILNSDGVLLKTATPDRVTIQGNDGRYAADYRATYSARSWIDKQYGDDFYLQEVDSLRISNDTLYISLARDSVPEKFVVLPASDDTSGYNLDFRISNDTLYIEDADGALFVDLDPYLDNTDTSGYNLGSRVSGDTLYIRDGDGEVAVELPADNDAQTLSIDSVSLESGERFVITISNGNSVAFDVPADTDNQTLDTFEIVSNVLRASLTDDGVPFKSVDLSPYLDNADEQELSVDSTDIGGIIERFEISISNGNSVFIDVPQVSGSGAGQNNVGINLGNGEDIYAGKVDTILQFKSLVELYGINLVSTDTTIRIEVDTAQVATLTDVGIVQADIDAHELADNDLDNENELQDLLLDSTIVGSLERFELSIEDGNSIFFDVPQTAGGDILNGGNTTGATVVIGTNDTQDLHLESDGTVRVQLRDDGMLYVGSTSNITYTPLSIEKYTNETSGTAQGLNVTQRLVPSSNSSMSPRSLNMGNTFNAPGINFTGAPQAGWFENRLQNVGDISNIYGITTSGILMGGDAATVGTVANATGIQTSGTSSFSNSIAGTVTLARGLLVNNSLKASLTITNQAGINVSALSSGTNNTSILLGTNSVPSGNFGIYSTITDPSYFAGTIGLGTASPNASALLDIVTTTKGLGLPSMTTTQRNAISTPRDGLVVYDETLDALYVRANGAWVTTTDTDNQTLDTFEIVSNVLRASISDDGVPFSSVNLSTYLDNTDEQGLSIDSVTISDVERFTIEIENGNSVSFDVRQDQTVAFIDGYGINTGGTYPNFTIEADTAQLATINDIIPADVVTIADSATLKAYTGDATAVIIKQFGREGTFVRSTTTLAHDGFIVFSDGSGRKWKRVFNGPLNVRWFGAKGDGVTDDQWAIQAAIDYSIYTDTTIKEVYLPTGEYLIGKTIHLGYGKAFHSTSIKGDGTPSFRGGVNEFNGTTILANFSNAPGINIQGARYSRISNLSIVGLNAVSGFLYDTSAANISNWIDAAVDTIGDNRRTPYAGITVDAYSGTAPTPGYPHIAYPSYANDTSQYSRLQSSQVKIDNVGVHEFVAGIVLQPNSDGNGDFIQIEKCIIDKVAYGVSVGNTNSRNLAIRDCYIDAHTCVTNSTHGNQVGRITLIENTHFGGYQWFDLQALPYLEGFEVSNCYGEAFYWLGTIGSVAGALPAIKFSSCDFSQTGTGNRNLQDFGLFVGDGAFSFENCSFKGNRMYVFNNTSGGWITLDKCKFGADVFDGEPGDSVETYHDKFFRSFLFVMGAYPERIRVIQSRFHEYTETNPYSFPQTDGNEVVFPNNFSYVSYWQDKSITGVNVKYKDLGYPGGYLGVASAFDTYAITDRTFVGKTKTTYKHGIGPGDLLLFKTSNSDVLPIMITEIDAQDTITGLVMSNYAYDVAGNFAYTLVSTDLTSSNVHHISCRKFLNNYTITGDFTAGSTTVSNVNYVYNGSAAAANFDQYTPLLNADGLNNLVLSPVSTDTWIDSVLSTTSLRLSEVAVRTGTYPIQNCLVVDNLNREIQPVQQIVYGSETGLKSEAAFVYDSTNNRIGLNTNSPTRQLTLATKTTAESGAGILLPSDGTVDADPPHRIEFTATATGPYTQRGYISFDAFSNAGATPKGQAFIFGLITDGQSAAGNTSLSESQLAVNNSSYFTIANNLGRLRIQATSAGLYSTDVPWLLTNSAYTTNDATARLKVVGASADSSTTNYGLSVFNGFNQRTFSVRNDGNTIIGGRTVASELQVLEASGSGTNYTGFKAQAMASNLMYTLPAAAGTAGQQLTWNSSNILTWEDAGGSSTNVYNSDGDIKNGGTILDASGNDGFYFLVDNAATANDYVIRMAADYAADDAVTHWLHTTTGSDSLDIYSYDDGLYMEWKGQSITGEGFTISSNARLNLTADSILVQTLPIRTTLPFMVGLQGNTLSKIEGTTDGQVLVWDETGGGYWEIGTSSGADGDGIYDGSGTIASGAIATLASTETFAIAYNGGNEAIYVDDAGFVLIGSKDAGTFLGINNGSALLTSDIVATISVAEGSSLELNGDQFVFTADTGTVRLTLFEPSGSGTNYTMFTQPAMAASQIYALPVDAPNNGDALTWNTGGTLSWEASGGADGDGIYDGDGTLQAGTTNATLPTNATFRVDYDGGNAGISINDVTNQAFISGKSGTYSVYADDSNAGLSNGGGSWLTGSTYALVGTASVANTNTANDRLVIQSNSSGTAAASFGSAILFQGESSTTDDQDMARIAAQWTTATHVGREAKISFLLGDNGGSLAEAFKFDRVNGSGGAMYIGTSAAAVITNNTFSTAANYTFGNGGFSATLNSSLTSSATAVLFNASGNNTAASGTIGNTTFTTTTGTKYDWRFTSGYTVSSGSGGFFNVYVNPTINQTTSTGATGFMDISPTLTNIAGGYDVFRSSTSNSAMRFINQTGAATTSNFVGSIAAGTTSAPNASAQIDIVSTTKGLGAPVMSTAQRDAIGSPREGLVVYSSDNDALNLRDNGIWKRLPTTQTVLKTADETVNNSSTYQADDHLVFTAKANKKYVVKYYLYVEDVGFNISNGAMKIKITAPSATTLRYGATGGSGLAAALGDSATDIVVSDIFGSIPNEGHVVVTAYINPGAGDRTVTLEWAQYSADASDTKILEGSFLEYEEIN